MLLHRQQLHPCLRRVFLRKLPRLRLRSSIDLRNQNKRAAGLQNSKNLAHITRQVRPEKVGLYRRDEIEYAIRIRQLRHRALADLNPAIFNPSRIGPLGSSNTVLGIINPTDLSLSSDCRQLTHRSPAPATDIEDRVALHCVVVPRQDLCQTPVSYLRMR